MADCVLAVKCQASSVSCKVSKRLHLSEDGNDQNYILSPKEDVVPSRGPTCRAPRCASPVRKSVAFLRSPNLKEDCELLPDVTALHLHANACGRTEHPASRTERVSKCRQPKQVLAVWICTICYMISYLDYLYGFTTLHCPHDKNVSSNS